MTEKAAAPCEGPAQHSPETVKQVPDFDEVSVRALWECFTDRLRVDVGRINDDFAQSDIRPPGLLTLNCLVVLLLAREAEQVLDFDEAMQNTIITVLKKKGIGLGVVEKK